MGLSGYGAAATRSPSFGAKFAEVWHNVSVVTHWKVRLLKEKHVLYLVNRHPGIGLRVDGGTEIDSARRPDASLTVGDTVYHVHLKTGSYKMLDGAMRREALKSVGKLLEAAHTNET
jgi:hypothetical protein